MIKRISPKRKKELAQYAKTMKELSIYTFCQNKRSGWMCALVATEHHHVIYRSEAPKHENLHDPGNVIKVCRPCHESYHKVKDSRKEIVIERKLWELFPELRLKERYFEN